MTDLGEFQCPRNQYEIDQMKAVPYSSAVGNLQYARVCIRPDLAFVIGLLGRYQSNLGIEHWKLVKKVFALPARYEGSHANVQKI